MVHAKNLTSTFDFITKSWRCSKVLVSDDRDSRRSHHLQAGASPEHPRGASAEHVVAICNKQDITIDSHHSPKRQHLLQKEGACDAIENLLVTSNESDGHACDSATLLLPDHLLDEASLADLFQHLGSDEGVEDAFVEISLGDAFADGNEYGCFADTPSEGSCSLHSGRVNLNDFTDISKAHYCVSVAMRC
jgi:hypothetical protein